jgi:hypothetical protein
MYLSCDLSHLIASNGDEAKCNALKSKMQYNLELNAMYFETKATVCTCAASFLILEPEMEMKSSGRDASGAFIT